jgi:amino acid adenylation domain-containing protein
MPFCVELEGRIDLPAMKAALAELVQRHELLRCAFRMGAGGELALVVHDRVTVPLTVLEAGLSMGEILARLGEEKLRAFDLAAPPFLRVTLAPTAPGRHVALVLFHHSVHDGWSVPKLWGDLMAFYEAATVGAPVALPDLPLQYGDFAAWERRRVAPEGAERAALAAYWAEQLRDAPPPLELPRDFPRPANASGAPSVQARLQLDAAAVGALKRTAAALRVSLYAVCVAAYRLTLCEFGGTDDAIVASTYSIRPPGTENLVGYFLRMLLLRNPLRASDSFAALAVREMATLGAAVKHALLPLQDVVAAAKLPRAPGRSPAWQASITWDEEDWMDLSAVESACTTLRAREYEIADQYLAADDVTCLMLSSAAGLRLGMLGDAAIFKVETMERMARRMGAILLEAAAAAVDVPLAAAQPSRQAWPGASRPASAQQALAWRLNALAAPGCASALATQAAFSLPAPVDAAALRAALAAVYARHEVVRTRLELNPAGRLVGSALPASAPLPWREAAVGDAAALEAALDAEAAAPFDLRAGPLLRVALLALPDGGGALSVVVHHAGADAGAVPALCREVAAAYAAAAAGGDAGTCFPQLPLQYSDFAAWQSSSAAWVTRAELAFWKAQLAGAPQLLSLPTDRPRLPGAPGLASARLTGPSVPAAALAALGELVRRLRVAPAAIFMAAFHLTLARFSGQDDVVVGVTAARSEAPEMQLLVGNFANAVAVRAAVEADTPFEALVHRVDAALKAALAHSSLEHSAVAEAAGAARPLFQVFFELAAPAPALALGALRCKPLRAPGCGAAQVDLALRVEPAGGGVSAEYCADLFGATAISRILACYVQLLAVAAAAPGAPLGALEALPRAQRAELDLFSRGELRPELLRQPPVHEQFAARAAEAPGAPCLLFEGAAMTYGEVADAVGVLAARLRRAGVGNGAIVGVCMHRSFDLVIAMLAAMRAGGVYLPLDPAFPPGRLAMYVEDGRPAVVLATESSRAAAEAVLQELPPGVRQPALLSGAPTPGEALPPPAEVAAARAAVAPTDLAVLIFTSGSTGRPKGVEVTHRGVADMARGAYVEMLRATAADVFCLSTTISFDPHYGNALAALVCGAALAIAPPGAEADPPRMVAFLAAARVTVAELAPSVVTLLLRELAAAAADPARGVALRALLMSGEPLPPALARDVQRGVPALARGIYNAYGPTEFTVAATAQLLEPNTAVVPLGPPDSNARCYVVKPADVSRLQPAGALGELLLSGPRLARGYAGRPDLTAAAFVPNPFLPAGAGAEERELYGRAYRTGDLVAWDGAGLLHFHGRVDRQLKVNGVRIELAEVEEALAAAPGAASAAAVAVLRPGGSASKAIVGFVTPADADVAAALAHCAKKLLPAAVPAAILALASLPRLTSGKTDRRALDAAAVEALELAGGGDGGGDWFVPAATETEVAIQRLWGDVLSLRDEVSVTADFFRVGGNSLRAGVLAASIRSALQLPRFPASAVYRCKTVRALAELADELRAGLDTGAAGDGTASMKHAATSCAGANALRADAVKLELPAGWVLKPTRLPYWAYLIVQYVMLALTFVMVPVIWGGLIVAVLALQPYLAWYWLIPLWPVVALVGLLGYAALLIGLKWALVQRLRPGVYPLHGWMYARWATMRALQKQAGATFLPYLRRTPFYPAVLRALGANIESLSDVVIDSLAIFDFDLLTIGKGACIYDRALISGSFVAPANYFGRDPVLVMAPVVVGRHCHLGARCVVTAGSRIPDFHNLKPHAAPAHPGDAPTAGPLADFPHFTPEEHMPVWACAATSLLVHVFDSLGQVPALAVTILINDLIVGEVDLTASGATRSWGIPPDVRWANVAFAALFTVLFNWIEPICSLATHACYVLAWKWLAVGRLRPGTNVMRSRRALFAYAVLRRLVEAPNWMRLLGLLEGTGWLAALYRALGASVGRQVFLGGLSVVEFDALTVGDFVGSGSFSRANACDADGVVAPIRLEDEATVGNSAALYPGCVVGRRAVVGNDTVICADRAVPAHARVQGGIEYSVPAAEAGSDDDLAAAEDGRANGGRRELRRSAGVKLGLPSIVSTSQRSVAVVALPWYHSVCLVALLLLTTPMVTTLLWLPVGVGAVIMQQILWWMIPATYIVTIGVGAVLALGWQRLVREASGLRRLWAAGSASIFDMRALVVHANFADLQVFDGTPFAVWIWRALGFKVGTGAVLLGYEPVESALVSIGAGAVVELAAALDGHYLEFERFMYATVGIGAGCWVQEASRVMPGTEMAAGSRLLPGSMVLPGEVLAERMVWGGLPAEPLQKRDGGEQKSQGLMRSHRLDRRLRKGGSSITGGTGFLGGMASGKMSSGFASRRQGSMSQTSTPRGASPFGSSNRDRV